ncbi:MAG TPA: MFS transporter, partial [Rhodothermales bacterium]
AVSRLGVGLLLAASSGLVAVAVFGYAAAPIWGLFAACALFHGLGSGAIDAGLNFYASHHFSVRHMNWLHACWSLGATLGPIIMTAAVARNEWRMGYVTVGLILSVLAVLFLFTRHRWSDPPNANSAEAGTATAVLEPTTGAAEVVAALEDTPISVPVGIREAARHGVVRLQAALFFFYTGLEATVGQWAFTLLTESRGVGAEAAGAWVTIYWGSIGVGRILLGMVAARVGLDRMVRFSTITAVVGTALYALRISGEASALALLVCGFGLASIYPNLMTRTPQRLGTALAAHAIGFQVSAATLGAAGLPSLAGGLAERWGLEMVAYAAIGMALAVWAIHERLLRTDGGHQR